MSTYTVIEPGDRIVLHTDDWVDACTAALTENWPKRVGGSIPRTVRGTHPSHSWKARRCTGCGAWDNGSYGSQAPCGYDWSHDSLVSALERERNAR